MPKGKYKRPKPPPEVPDGTYNTEQLLEQLQWYADRYSQADMARMFGVSRAYICDVLSGKRGIGPSILRGLGLEVCYRLVEGAPQIESKEQQYEKYKKGGGKA